MNISIKNSSFLLKINEDIKNKIKKSIGYILKKEEVEGNSIFKKFLSVIKIEDIEINLKFVDDKEIIKCNKQFFNKITSTDVIAFSMIEGELLPDNHTLGDAIISVETAKRNSTIYSISLIDELFLLIIHSILHLMGYEHEDENGEMRIKEKRYYNYIKKNYI